jgi:hypothetical protein
VDRGSGGEENELIGAVSNPKRWWRNMTAGLGTFSVEAFIGLANGLLPVFTFFIDFLEGK